MSFSKLFVAVLLCTFTQAASAVEVEFVTLETGDKVSAKNFMVVGQVLDLAEGREYLVTLQAHDADTQGFLQPSIQVITDHQQSTTLTGESIAYDCCSDLEMQIITPKDGAGVGPHFNVVARASGFHSLPNFISGTTIIRVTIQVEDLSTGDFWSDVVEVIAR